MGVQSFDDGVLRWMGRRHDAAGAKEAFDTLRRAGFENISIDLMSGIPGLSDKAWDDTLSEALSLRPEHVSSYQLSVEDGSALERLVEAEKVAETEESQCSRQYRHLCERLGEAGYQHYEISNFALPGHRARHNSAYWRRVPYVGLGAGAHSFDGRRRSWNSRDISHYAAESELLSEEDERVETIMLALRTSDGMSASWLRRHCDLPTLDRLTDSRILVPATEPKSPDVNGSADHQCKDATDPLCNDPADPHCKGPTDPRLRIAEDHFFVSDDIIRSLI